ncbi:MAG: hypothetical protein AAF191_05455 [Verrucomicrobiota bacterium]
MSAEEEEVTREPQFVRRLDREELRDMKRAAERIEDVLRQIRLKESAEDESGDSPSSSPFEDDTFR